MFEIANLLIANNNIELKKNLLSAMTDYEYVFMYPELNNSDKRFLVYHDYTKKYLEKNILLNNLTTNIDLVVNSCFSNFCFNNLKVEKNINFEDWNRSHIDLMDVYFNKLLGFQASREAFVLKRSAKAIADFTNGDYSSYEIYEPIFLSYLKNNVFVNEHYVNMWSIIPSLAKLYPIDYCLKYRWSVKDDLVFKYINDFISYVITKNITQDRSIFIRMMTLMNSVLSTMVSNNDNTKPAISNTYPILEERCYRIAFAANVIIATGVNYFNKNKYILLTKTANQILTKVLNILNGETDG